MFMALVIIIALSHPR